MKMKNGSKKTKIFICAVMMCLIFTAYAFWEDVPNLINSDEPFIDLDSIGDSIGAAKIAYEEAHPSPIPSPVPTQIPDVDDPTPTPIVEKEIQIMVGDEIISGSGEVIIMEGIRIKNPEDFKSTITKPDYEGKTFLLIDYYAESMTFKKVKSILDEIGISYKIETWDSIPTEGR
ncbi:MAG: hypothetical protein IK014_02085 [Lachnospiraceae bacterium]|nr:hypothetical protein [Lachnospiraceae bacterium]